jgi:hypothetical protein
MSRLAKKFFESGVIFDHQRMIWDRRGSALPCSTTVAVFVVERAPSSNAPSEGDQVTEESQTATVF